MATATFDTLPVTEASFMFFHDEEKFDFEKPYSIGGDLDAEMEERRSNYTLEKHGNIPVRDLRGHEHQVTLESHGFRILNRPSKVSLDQPGDHVIEEYLLETIGMVKEELQADLVLCYEYRFRRSQTDPTDPKLGYGKRYSPDKPIPNAHVDQTVDGGPRRARRHLSAKEAAKYLNGDYRVRILNLWRPLYHPVQEAPLAFCDSTSVDREKDLVAIDRIIKDYAGEVYVLRHNPEQRWYYLSEMKPEEIAMFLSYDSDPGSGCSFCPHASFTDPASPANARPRESLEIRVIAISKI